MDAQRNWLASSRFCIPQPSPSTPSAVPATESPANHEARGEGIAASTGQGNPGPQVVGGGSGKTPAKMTKTSLKGVGREGLIDMCKSRSVAFPDGSTTAFPVTGNINVLIKRLLAPAAQVAETESPDKRAWPVEVKQWLVEEHTALTLWLLQGAPQQGMKPEYRALDAVTTNRHMLHDKEKNAVVFNAMLNRLKQHQGALECRESAPDLARRLELEIQQPALFVKNSLQRLVALCKEVYGNHLRGSGASGDAGGGTCTPAEARRLAIQSQKIAPGLLDALVANAAARTGGRHQQEPVDTAITPGLRLTAAGEVSACAGWPRTAAGTRMRTAKRKEGSRGPRAHDACGLRRQHGAEPSRRARHSCGG